MQFYVQQDERGGARSSDCTHTHVHHTLISLNWPGRRVHHTTCSTQTLFMHTKCIHAHKPNHWPEENKNSNKKLVQNSRHHDRPHHLVLPTHFTAQRRQSPWPPSPSCLTTHFTAQRLQSPSCLSHTLHATEATVTTAAVRPPTQCKHSETRRTRKRKRKEKEKKRKRKKGKEQCP